MTRSASSTNLSVLEKLVLLHVAIFLLGASWIYGGNIWWMKPVLSVWGSLGAALTLAAFLQPGSSGREARAHFVWMLPFALFGVLVGISLANPSFRAVIIDGETAYVKSAPPYPLLPSTISPEISFRSWWLGAGVYFSALNIALVVKSRAALRGLLVLIGVNTLVLAVLGTVQKLLGASFFLGADHAPNTRFFSTFIYYNHWGAFMFLGLAAAIGLLFYYSRRHTARDLWHSPMPLAAVAVLLIAASGPVSGSRAATIIVAFLLTVATIHALVRVILKRRSTGRSPWPPALCIAVLALLSISVIGWLSQRSLTERYTETRRALDAERSIFGGRAELYRDTWQLAQQEPLFGWGLDTYTVGLQTIRPVRINFRDRSENFYGTAHNDWLQSLAETGFIGTGLLLLTAALPLASLPRRMLFHPLVGYPLLGCAVVAAYALLEFPFANPAVLVSICILFFATIRQARLTDSASR